MPPYLDQKSAGNLELPTLFPKMYRQWHLFQHIFKIFLTTFPSVLGSHFFDMKCPQNPSLKCLISKPFPSPGKDIKTNNYPCTFELFLLFCPFISDHRKSFTKTAGHTRRPRLSFSQNRSQIHNGKLLELNLRAYLRRR